eukprot:CAMPEP_0176439060 /NCGR_PEP_ID=MMETSP0127-20121128/19696_1 /TAXON_ID=938130 /ORGANISM="Platyophrya macrostoma, Strain WH" /LENGTH=385 /DNA_ID=CAMNT_0017823213 /DNA_START=177 /DNA_END=1334 /DNA_ORIENTATION=+
MIAQPKLQRNKESEFAKASAIVSDVKTVKAQDAVMRYSEIIKDRALVIEMSKGDPAKINDLLPYIESIVWGSKNLNLDCVKELEQFIYNAFGPGVYENLLKGANVQAEIKECFDSILPSEKEVKKYMIEFCRKNSIEIELMNEIGHNISENLLFDMPDNGNAGLGGNTGYPGGGNNAGGFGGGVNIGGGYPGGGTIQVDPSKNININVGFYPNQYQPYQQQPYQQQQYQQQQYQPQQQYQQQPYQQQQYNPQQYQQPTYQQQQPYQQPNYQQQQPYQQPNYQQQNIQPTYQQPTYQPNLQQQQPFQDNTQSPFSGGPTGGITTTTTTTNNNINPTTDTKNVPLSFESSDTAYPTFKKMNIDPYQPGPKNDLDEFQNRLKRIKDGL